MNIDIVSLCDAAVETNGRLNLIGTIDYFWASKLPYVHPTCTLALRFRFEPQETGKHNLRIQVVDPDGVPMTSRAEFNLNVTATDDDIPLLRHVLLEIKSLRFDKYGPHAILVNFDGQTVASLPFPLVPPRQTSKRPRVSS